MIPDAAVVQAADYSARYWIARETGVLKPGSEAHKRAVCEMFRRMMKRKIGIQLVYGWAALYENLSSTKIVEYHQYPTMRVTAVTELSI